jgi:hypothetical protein
MSTETIRSRAAEGVVNQVGKDFGVAGEELFEDEVVFGAEEGLHGGFRIAWDSGWVQRV